MDRTEIETTTTELLDAADKLQALIVDVQGIITRLGERLQG